MASSSREDYRTMAGHGMRTVRDGLRWHLIEATPGQFDWSSFLPMLRCQPGGGRPADLGPLPLRLARRHRHLAAELRGPLRQVRGGGSTGGKDETSEVPFYAAINEISLLGLGRRRYRQLQPDGARPGHGVKVQLVRAPSRRSRRCAPSIRVPASSRSIRSSTWSRRGRATGAEPRATGRRSSRPGTCWSAGSGRGWAASRNTWIPSG